MKLEPLNLVRKEVGLVCTFLS